MSEQAEGRIKRQFLTTRQGRDFVLYAGLLDLAHQEGLSGIVTDLIQIPSPENGNVAIVRAIATFNRERCYTGIGDASPENVGRMIVPHLIRMAETRAKARALRDAVNIGTAAVEELGGDDEPPAPQPERPPEPPRVVAVGHAAKREGPAVPFAMPVNQATGRPYTESELRLRYRELVDKAAALGLAHRQLAADAPLGAIVETARGLHKEIQAAELAIPAGAI